MIVGISRTTSEWEVALGDAVRTLRLRANTTQADLARQANVGISALRALEQGRGSSLATFIPVVRALGREDWLDALAPPAAVSPLAVLAESRRGEQGRRRHASPRTSAQP